MTQNLPIFVINLDRRPDRRDWMAAQLDGLGLAWERIPAVDMETVTDARLAAEIRPSGHRIAMGRGSQCVTLTNFEIYRRMIADDLPVAVVMEDDVELSPDIVPFLRDLAWLPPGIGLVQFEKFGTRASRRLCGPAIGTMPVPGRSLHRLYQRAVGAACYLVTKAGARHILETKGMTDIPIDHLLFSPNVSPVYDGLGVAIVAPSLARQRMETFTSDISAERTSRKKPLAARARRLGYELNRLPSQLWAMAQGARMTDYDFAMTTGEPEVQAKA